MPSLFFTVGLVFRCSQPGHLRSLRSCLPTVASRESSDSSPCGGGSVKSNTMPAIAVSLLSPTQTDDKDGFKNGRDAPDRTSASMVAGSIVSDSQSSQPFVLGTQRYYERVAAGCEGIVHTVAVHYAHAPFEDVTTKYIFL